MEGRGEWGCCVPPRGAGQTENLVLTEHLASARHCADCLAVSAHKPHAACMYIVPILQMQKLRFRKVQSFAQSDLPSLKCMLLDRLCYSDFCFPCGCFAQWIPAGGFGSPLLKNSIASMCSWFQVLGCSLEVCLFKVCSSYYLTWSSWNVPSRSGCLSIWKMGILFTCVSTYVWVCERETEIVYLWAVW